jgi:hypothetical protein
MSLKKCKECGNQVSTKADACPSCGAKIKSKSKNYGCGTLIVILILIGMVWSQIDGCLEKREKEVQLEKEQAAATELATKRKAELEKAEAKEKADFEKNIEQHYQKLVSFYEKKSISEGLKEVALFRKYDKSDYKDLPEISKRLTIMDLEQKVKDIPVSEAWKNLTIYNSLAKLDPENKRYKQKVAFYQTKVDLLEEEEERKRKEYQASLARFGKKPTNSSWDGSVRCVETYMKEAAKDPDSLEFEKWGRVAYNSTDGWIVWCKYRAKNSFGGYVRERKWFVIRHNMVVDVKPFTAYSYR